MFWSFLIVVMATYSSAWASSECLAIESFQVDDTCNTVLGWGWTGGACEEVTGCSSTDLNGNDLAPYLYADEWGCYEGCAACPVVDPSDFGLCSMILGIAWTGSSCDYVSGCGTVDGSGVDRANWFFNSGDLDADMAACEQSCDGCPDLSLSDFGQCKMLLGHGWDGMECAPVSGCDRIDANTQEDQSAWIFPSVEECGERCEQCDVVDRGWFWDV